MSVEDIKGVAIILVIICIGLIFYISGDSRTDEEIGMTFSMLELLTILAGVVTFFGVIISIISN